MLDQVPLLDRSAQFDLMGALAGEGVQDDGSMDAVELHAEVVELLRAALEAPPGQVHEIVRRRLQEVGEALDLMSFPGFEPDIKSYDLVTDLQLCWTIGLRLQSEVQATAEDGASDALPEALGQRVLAFPGRERRRLLMRTAQARNILSPNPSLARQREMVEQVLAGDTSDVPALHDRPDASRAQKVGRWICDSLYDGVQLQPKGDALPDEAVTMLSAPAGELLATWILMPHAREGSRYGEGIDASSPRTRARKARSARAAAALGLTALLRLGPPSSPYSRQGLPVLIHRRASVRDGSR